MTDRFEEAVRAAARDLGEAGPAPTYHAAWQRGRRRRASKQAALAFAGAAVLVAVLTVGFPGLNGSRLEGDDLAVDLQAGAPGVVLATPTVAEVPTAPVDLATPTTDPAAVVAIDASADAAGTATPDATPPVPTPQPSVAPQTPAPSQPVVPAPEATRAATPPPPPTAVRPATPPPATRTPSTSSGIGPTAVPTPSDQSALIAPSPVPGITSTPDGPNQTPTPAPVAPLQTTKPAAAIVIGPLGTSVGTRCDTNGDGVADATCEIQWPYACSAGTEARLGYQAVDLSGNGLIDTCTPTSTAFCDTTGDGLGDTPCVIKPDPAQ